MALKDGILYALRVNDADLPTLAYLEKLTLEQLQQYISLDTNDLEVNGKIIEMNKRCSALMNKKKQLVEKQASIIKICNDLKDEQLEKMAASMKTLLELLSEEKQLEQLLAKKAQQDAPDHDLTQEESKSIKYSGDAKGQNENSEMDGANI